MTFLIPYELDVRWLYLALVICKTLLPIRESHIQHLYKTEFKGVASPDRDASLGAKFGNQPVKEQISSNLGLQAQEAIIDYGAQFFRASP